MDNENIIKNLYNDIFICNICFESFMEMRKLTYHLNKKHQLKLTPKEYLNQLGDGVYDHRVMLSSNKRKKTCLEKYNVDSVSKSKEIKNKIKQTTLELYGVESTLFLPHVKLARTQTLKNNMDEINIKRSSYWDVDGNKQSALEKRKQTTMNSYGVENVSQNCDIYDSSQKYRWKEYILPSGKSIKIQGYENFALDLLLCKYNETEIITSKNKIPEIWYIDENNKQHRYYADIYIPKDNLIIEVKSTWTYKKYLNINLLKAQATKSAGYNFKFLIFDAKANLVQGEV